MSEKDNNESLFETLFRDYYQAVYSFFTRSGFPSEEARDLSQTTFLRVYEGLKAYRGEAKWSWILQIAKNVRSNELRFRGADRRKDEKSAISVDVDHLDEIGSLQALGVPPPSQYEEVLKNERTQKLKAAKDQLEPEARHYLDLWLQDCSYKEIMEVMGVSLDTVKSKLYRARKALGDAVRKETDIPDLDWPLTRGEKE